MIGWTFRSQQEKYLLHLDHCMTDLATQAHTIVRAAINLTVNNDSSKGKRPITKVDDGITAKIDKRMAF